MAQTLRQVISDLAQDIKTLNIDDRLPIRFLANKFKDKIQVFIRQDARSRELIRETNIWKPINCVDLKDVPAIDCHDISDDRTIKKSATTIPEAYSTTYGNLIKVLTLNGTTEFKQINSFDYKDYANREYGNGKYFWIANNYVFIPNSTLKSVKILIIAKNPQEVDFLNGVCNKCVSPLDAELNYPPYLITAAKQAVLQELLAGTKQIVPDEKPNANENDKA